jgi:hypothetical protein
MGRQEGDDSRQVESDGRNGMSETRGEPEEEDHKKDETFQGCIPRHPTRELLTMRLRASHGGLGGTITSDKDLHF